VISFLFSTKGFTKGGVYSSPRGKELDASVTKVKGLQSPMPVARADCRNLVGRNRNNQSFAWHRNGPEPRIGFTRMRWYSTERTGRSVYAL